MMRFLLSLIVISGIAVAALYATGHLTHDTIAALGRNIGAHSAEAKKSGTPTASAEETLAAAISAVRVDTAAFTERVLVTGSLVAREEVLIAPEVEGLRVLSYHAEEGDSIRKGQLLVKLDGETTKAQLDQNTAELARADAAIAQAKSQIIEAEALVAEALANLKRAKPLKSSGYLSGSTFDQRQAAERTTKARLVSAKDGLIVAKADKARLEARRREIVWRLEKTDVLSPVDGRIANRTIRIGAMATSAGDPMYRIIANGQIELEAEADESQLAKIKTGQLAQITIAGVGNVKGTVRLVSPEVDKASRLGTVRVFLGESPALRIGAFGRGTIETAKSVNLAVPSTSILYGRSGPRVQRIVDNRVESVSVETGTRMDALTEIRSGLTAGDMIVAKAGSFLREGDRVRVITPVEKLSRVDR